MQELLTSLSFFFLVLISIFLPRYIREKAKNLAQKEDLNTLTDIVKGVEFKFDERLTYLKSQLDLNTQMQLGLHNEERNSLIELHNNVCKWWAFMSDPSFDSAHVGDNASLDKALDKRSALNEAAMLSKFRASLFINDDVVGSEIESNLDKLSKEINAFSKKFLEQIFDHQKLNRKYEFDRSLDTYRESKRKLIEQYEQQINEFIEISSPLLNELTLSIKSYLKLRLFT